MTSFSLPITHPQCTAAFSDSASATAWLARQPQANAPAMLSELVAQIHAFNAAQVLPRERFKTLEVLRKTIFAVSLECQRRFENKPLPLLRGEQLILDSVRQLWSAATVAYLHGLRACLDRDPTILRYGARVAHRVLACLRMEQTSCYLGGAELSAEFWRKVHAVLASAEQLGVVREPVVDKLLGTSGESTVGGQYAMTILLHLAQPYRLSRVEFTSVNRWFTRWRELAVLEKEAPAGDNPKAVCIAVDLAATGPVLAPDGVAGAARWLMLGDVLGKMRQRLRLLAAGETPDSLKLGSGLSAPACTALLSELCERLRNPPVAPAAALGEVALTLVASGLENIHPLLGGKGLKDVGAVSALHADQLAIFGHVVRESEDELVHPERRAETWQLTGQLGERSAGVISLLRPAGCGDARLTLRGLLAVRLAPRPGEAPRFALAAITSLYSRDDLSVCLSATVLPGKPLPLVVEINEKANGKISRHPAFVLSGKDDPASRSIVVPAALPARAASLRLYRDGSPTRLNLRLGELIERGGDHERWSLISV